MCRRLTFRPLRVGPIELATPAVLAGLAGYSDLMYRRICRQLGAGYCTTEVVLDTSVNLSPKLRHKLVQVHTADHPLAGQIMGCAPATMASAGRHLQEMGCDVVDLNFACPVRKVLRRRRGGHMLRAPDTGIAVLRAVADAVEVPWTVKLRRSFDQADRTHEVFWRIAESAFDAGAAAICVHGRSVEARYNGPADWEFLAEVKRRFPGETIIGSGDLHSADDGVRMLTQTGLDGIAFARGALGNPWIFRQFEQLLAGQPVAKVALSEQRAVLNEHCALCVERFGPVPGRRMMRRFGIRYARMHPTPGAVRQAFIRWEGGRELADIIDRYYT